MPQIFNLGGVKIQKVDRLQVGVLKDISGHFPIFETVYDSSQYGMSHFENKTVDSFNWRNVSKIIAKNGHVVNVENIEEGLPVFREDWEATGNYAEYEVVEYNGNYYQVPAETPSIAGSAGIPGDSFGVAANGWIRYHSTELFTEILDTGE
jgi:hypothetical protein